jgi:hypothetical protein
VCLYCFQEEMEVVGVGVNDSKTLESKDLWSEL